MILGRNEISFVISKFMNMYKHVGLNFKIFNCTHNYTGLQYMEKLPGPSTLFIVSKENKILTKKYDFRSITYFSSDGQMSR